MSEEKARLRAMQAIGKLLPADESGKMEERAIKGYIELLETRLDEMGKWHRELIGTLHEVHLVLGSAAGEDILTSTRRMIADYQKLLEMKQHE